MAFQQRVVTVQNLDTVINAEIDEQIANNWILAFIIIWSDDSKVILLFNKTVV